MICSQLICYAGRESIVQHPWLLDRPHPFALLWGYKQGLSSGMVLNMQVIQLRICLTSRIKNPLKTHYRWKSYIGIKSACSLMFQDEVLGGRPPIVSVRAYYGYVTSHSTWASSFSGLPYRSSLSDPPFLDYFGWGFLIVLNSPFEFSSCLSLHLIEHCLNR